MVLIIAYSTYDVLLNSYGHVIVTMLSFVGVKIQINNSNVYVMFTNGQVLNKGAFVHECLMLIFSSSNYSSVSRGLLLNLWKVGRVSNMILYIMLKA